MDISIHLVFRCFLGGIFLVSFLSKIRNPFVFFVKMKKYNLLPKKWVPWIGSIILLVELFLAIGYFTGIQIQTTALVGMILLSIFTFALGWNIYRGNLEIDCGCFGYLTSGQRIGWNLVVRNFLLILFSAFLLLPIQDRVMFWGDFLNIGFTIFVLGILYVSFNHIFTIMNKEFF